MITLLDRAKGDYDVAVHSYNNALDEVHVDIAAYHCQQCVEKLIKYKALEKGKELNQHHHLSALLRELEDEHYNEILGEIVYDMASWSSAVRYSQHAVAGKAGV